MNREYKQLIFLLGFLIICTFLSTSIESVMFLSSGMFWNWAKESQLLRERSQTKRYKYSFSRLFYFYCDIFPKKNEALNLFLNTLSVSIFIGFLAIIFESQATFYYAFLGSFIYELFDLCWRRIYQKKLN